MPNCVLLGYSDLFLIEEFNLGLRAIDKGRMFEKQGECIISQDFAKLNDFEPGDKFSIFNVDAPEDKVTLTIAGIYLDVTEEQTNNAKLAINNRRNEILVSYETLTIMGVANVYTNATYYLGNPEYGEEFEAELHEKGLPDIYNVNIDSGSYFQIVNPVRGLLKVSNIMMLVVIVFGCSILILLSILSVRERKYEIGVLRAMGMEKGRVAVGLLVESFVIIAMCLAVGLGIGSFIAQPISDSVLNDQLSIAQKNYIQSDANYGEGVISQETKNEVDYQAFAKVQVRVTPDMIILTIGIALLFGLLSNGFGILYITRFEPIRILTERE